MSTENVEIKMTWKTAASIMEIAIMNGTDEGKRLAVIEMRRMAAAADYAIHLEKVCKELTNDIRRLNEQIESGVNMRNVDLMDFLKEPSERP